MVSASTSTGGEGRRVSFSTRSQVTSRSHCTSEVGSRAAAREVRLRAPSSEGVPDDLSLSEAEPPARVIANSAWSLLAVGVTAIVGGVVGIYAIRSFTPAEWGHYATALALIALFTV